MTNDTTPTYRIKPLAWECHDNGKRYTAGGKLGNVAIYVALEGDCYWVACTLGDIERNNSMTLDEAKRHAESAYRALVAEHLEEVK